MTESEVRQLLQPDNWPDAPEAIRLITTHTSWVFLTGKRAYKIKKPVFFGFLDYTTVDARKLFCEEELRLNRRLSPDIYLGVKPVTRVNNRIQIGGEGEVIDYCVEMKELPQEAMMSARLERKEVTYPMINELARVVAQFHQVAGCDEHISRFGDEVTVRFNWDENFAQTEEFCGRTISRPVFTELQQKVNRFLVRNRRLLKRRIEQRRIRECHGDLHSRNVFIVTQPPGDGFELRVFDCIEFNRRFSCCDVASEIAFLVMDLEYAGEYGLATYFVDRYLELSRDYELLRLLDFYKCYRAYVRGKVTSFLLNDPALTPAAKTAAQQTARRYFRLAHHYAQSIETPPVLILMLGLPGVGKTYLAERLAGRLNCHHIRSDIVRKELMALPVGQHAFQGIGSGIYTANISARTYREMERRAGRQLKAGRTVILDATFALASGRQQARRLAQKHRSGFLMINCVCPVKTALRRIARRKREFSFSDATPEVYFHIRRSFQPITRSREVVTVNTTQSIPRILRRVQSAVQRLRSRL